MPALPPAPAARWPDAAGDSADPTLADLARDLWEEMLRADPVFASAQGDERYLGELADRSPAGRRQRHERLAALQVRAQALDTTALDAADRLSLGLLREELQRALVLCEADLERWLVDPRGAPHVECFNLVVNQPSATQAQREAMEQRWAAMAGLSWLQIRHP
jgi:uncharacterized protein (DUF885 family)